MGVFILSLYNSNLLRNLYRPVRRPAHGAFDGSYSLTGNSGLRGVARIRGTPMWRGLLMLAAAKREPSRCWRPDGQWVACGPGVEKCGPEMPAHLAPRYHVFDRSGCKISDPDFPFFDSVHGAYHLFFQYGIALPGGHGAVIGHVVSRDMVRSGRS